MKAIALFAICLLVLGFGAYTMCSRDDDEADGMDEDNLRDPDID